MPEYEEHEDECSEIINVDGGRGGGGTLACWLPSGHTGPHYDEADDVTWKRGKPNA